ncbi:MAG: hypothetical protein ACK55I_25550, partial [bacterium]
LREKLPVVFCRHQVTHLTAKTHRKLSRVGRLNDLGPRLIAHDERRQEIGRELRLGVPRRHVDDQALDVAIGYGLQVFSHGFNGPSFNEGRRVNVFPSVFQEQIKTIFAVSLIQFQQLLVDV